jgi:hypothetical protein
MKQALLSFLRRPSQQPATAVPALRELDRAALRQVAGGGGGGETDAPKTGW